jgi:hypothetical protein
VLAGIGAIHGRGIRLEPLPPSGCQLRFAFRLRTWFAVWLGAPPSPQFGYGLPGCLPGGVRLGGPLFVPGVAAFKALASGGAAARAR